MPLREAKALLVKRQQYEETDRRIKEVLSTLTDREIAMMSISRFAREAGVSRTTIHHHRDVYRLFLERKKKCV